MNNSTPTVVKHDENSLTETDNNEETCEDVWGIEAMVFNFHNKEDADAFQHLLIDAFCSIPEAKNVGMSTSVVKSKITD